jgi:hypothetical protein
MDARGHLTPLPSPPGGERRGAGRWGEVRSSIQSVVSIIDAKNGKGHALKLYFEFCKIRLKNGSHALLMMSRRSV